MVKQDLYERVEEASKDLNVSRKTMLTAYQTATFEVNQKYGFNSDKFTQGAEAMNNFMQFKDDRVFRYTRALMYKESKNE